MELSRNLLKCPTYKKSRKKECFHPDIPFYSSPLSPLPCQLECKYSCIRKSTNLRKEKNLPIVKYHGKWPFTRLEWFSISLKSEFNQIFIILITFGSENVCQNGEPYQVWVWRVFFIPFLGWKLNRRPHRNNSSFKNRFRRLKFLFKGDLYTRSCRNYYLAFFRERYKQNIKIMYLKKWKFISWKAQFHARETNLSELLDYFGHCVEIRTLKIPLKVV